MHDNITYYAPFRCIMSDVVQQEHTGLYGIDYEIVDSTDLEIPETGFYVETGLDDDLTPNTYGVAHVIDELARLGFRPVNLREADETSFAVEFIPGVHDVQLGCPESDVLCADSLRV